MEFDDAIVLNGRSFGVLNDTDLYTDSEVHTDHQFYLYMNTVPRGIRWDMLLESYNARPTNGIANWKYGWVLETEWFELADFCEWSFRLEFVEYWGIHAGGYTIDCDAKAGVLRIRQTGRVTDGDDPEIVARDKAAYKANHPWKSKFFPYKHVKIHDHAIYVLNI